MPRRRRHGNGNGSSTSTITRHGSLLLSHARARAHAPALRACSRLRLRFFCARGARAIVHNALRHIPASSSSASSSSLKIGCVSLLLSSPLLSSPLLSSPLSLPLSLRVAKVQLACTRHLHNVNRTLMDLKCFPMSSHIPCTSPGHP